MKFEIVVFDWVNIIITAAQNMPIITILTVLKAMCKKVIIVWS